jgi:Rod binding domain-containing protein
MTPDTLFSPMKLPQQPQLPTATPEQRKKIETSAQAFEGQLISQLLQPMFAGLKTDAPFGGGEGEATFRSFMLEAIGKQTAKSGGLHLAKAVTAEMLKMQGLQ